MKFTQSWLEEYLQFDASTAELVDKLTAIGLEVEELEDHAAAYADFRVAKIIDAVKHENSDKLSICKVENHKGEVLQIVCGAKNARAGIKIALAPIGSVIPANKMVIKKAKVAGVESNGMICSASELLLGEDGDGIIEIDDKYEVGTLISEIYGLNDAIIDVNITPNRGDCLGVYGVARDLAAAGFGKLIAPKITATESQFALDFNAKITADSGCNLALFRKIKNVKNCQSPDWLKNKLEKVGINSISAIVDITNYVMMVLNRPMHAYDASKISGDINIRFAQSGEKFSSLNDIDYDLNEEILTISDDKNILAIAGVIGSKDSGCSEETSDIILDSAFFTPDEVAKSGRVLNILSDSRYRFERGVDYKSCQQGIDLATKLISEICGGSAGDVLIVESKNFDKTLRQIVFDFKNVKKLIGIDIDESQAIDILHNLGFAAQKDAQNYVVTIPSHRSDVEGKADIIEEIVRIYGYDKIKTEKISLVAKKNDRNFYDQVRSHLVAAGLVENINYSFCDSKFAAEFTDIKDELFIANPIAENLDYMRPNLVIGLLQSYKKNYLRGGQDAVSFEIGRVFQGTAKDLQNNVIAGLFAGRDSLKSYFNEDRDFDIFDAKGLLFDLIEVLGVKSENLIIDDSAVRKYCHPHRYASFKLGKIEVAYVAQLHPKITKKLGIKKEVYIFEMFIDQFAPKLLENFAKINKKSFSFNDLQPVYRDYAFVIDQDSKTGELIKIIKNCDKKLINNVEIFDIYQGDNLEQGKKSIALRVKVQPQDGSLTTEQIDQISENIIKQVEAKIAGKIRS